MERLRQTVERGLLDLDVSSSELVAILRRAVDVASSEGLVPAEFREQLLSELLKRERTVSTAIGNAVAVPHAYLDGITKSGIVFLRLTHPVNLGAPDGIPTQFLFVLIGPPGQAEAHLDTLTTIARLMSDDEFRFELGESRSRSDLLAALDRFQARTAPEALGVEEISPGLQYTGRLAGGVIADIRRRLPYYKSDFGDGLHLKTLTTTLFLYFACLAPTITFGGLMDSVTNHSIGATEMLVATGIVGISFALLGGQPLIILGSTGPLLVFVAVLYALCTDLQLADAFLPIFAWVGLWTGIFTMILALTDASCLIRFFTRFTDEIFAALISLIYITEAMHSIVGYVRSAGEPHNPHDKAFLSLMLALGTFAMAMLLSRIRSSRYLQPGVRVFLADFGPTLAVVLLLLFGRLFPNVSPDPLNVPESFGPTNGRDRWLIDLFSVPSWIWLASMFPAMVATVLVYLDQNITARLVNSRDHRLRKGEGYHVDLLFVGAAVAGCSLFGLPWFVAATVRSLNHVRALATTEEVVSRNGDRRERILRIRENRVSGLAIHTLILCSILLLPVLPVIPMPVLYGLFLYMGVVSIAGNQFFERVNLWLMDPDLYPRTHYTRRVPIRTIHAFTALQVACLMALWVVKESPIGIAFPVFVAALVPVRLLADRWFAPEHLEALDAEVLPEEEISEWA